MNKMNTQKTINATDIFGRRFLESKSLYLYRFNLLPSIHFISWIDGEKAYRAFREKFSSIIESEHQFRGYDIKRRKYEFDETILVLTNHCLVEFNMGYCEILHDGNQSEFLSECTELTHKFRNREKRKPLEINLVVRDGNCLGTRSMEVRRTKLDLNLYYDDSFADVDRTIMQRLNRKKDKGIVLLHCLPGTGKTTYLRNLVGRIRKRVLFLSPGVACNLMDPEFIDLLIDNADTVLIIEDAERIIMDRWAHGSSAVSALLNISDGLLADFLNVQMICTFNSPLTTVDSALMRKGRLIARYEFGKLSVKKAQRLSDHLGFEALIDRPMTVAEIANQHEKDLNQDQVEIIGFKRSVLEN
jgi:hypothetical protein